MEKSNDLNPTLQASIDISSQSSNLSSSPTHPPHRHLPKWAIILIISSLLLVIISIVSIQLLSYQQVNKQQQMTSAKPTSTPDPTANWKTFENTKYGYLLKVPSDWIKQDENEYTNEYFYQSFSPTDEKHCELGGYPCYPTIYLTVHNQVSKKSSFKTLSEYFNFIYNLPINQETRTNIDGSPKIVKIIEKTMVNNEKAVRYFISIPPEFDGIDTARTTEVIDIFKNGRIYSLSHNIFTEVKSQKIDYTQDEEELKIFNQILSTFKFLD